MLFLQQIRFIIPYFFGFVNPCFSKGYKIRRVEAQNVRFPSYYTIEFPKFQDKLANFKNLLTPSRSMLYNKMLIFDLSERTLRELFKKSSLRTLKNFWGKFTTKSQQFLLQRGLRVILALRAKARSA
jgi:hypothetical protein